MKKIFSASPVWQNNGLFLIRIIAGFLLIWHGWEIFNAEKMKGYVSWDMFKTKSFLPYFGKATELAGGVLLFLGLFTRIGCLLLIGAFAYITFFVGKGKFWMDDQHPFLFVLIAMLFIFTGPGVLALDNLLFKKK